MSILKICKCQHTVNCHIPFLRLETKLSNKAFEIFVIKILYYIINVKIINIKYMSRRLSNNTGYCDWEVR